MTVPTDPPAEPRVQCPTCGKRFRVDPSAFARRGDGAPARCSGCGAAFRVRGGLGAPPKTSDARTRTPASAPDRPSPATAAGSGSRPAAPFRSEDLALAFGIGDRLGRYEIEAILGRGGMGAVYRAFDPVGNRHVALKVLAAHAPREDRARFQREVEVQGNIQHPHIMPIFDSGTLGRARYFTMELLAEPVNLADLVVRWHAGDLRREPRLRPLATLEGLLRRVFLPVCQAVHHANTREGVLHRDVKPENVLVDLSGLRPFLIDFGVCSLLDRKNVRLSHLPKEIPARLAGGGLRVTGTLLYMPPEQARGRVDRRGDVWGLGAILHHLFTGQPPYESASRSSVSAAERIEGLTLLVEQARRDGQSKEASEYESKRREVAEGRERTLEDLQKDVLAGRARPRPSGTPPALDAIIAKAMAAEPEQRYRHAHELSDDLEAWLDRRTVKAHAERRGRVGGFLYRTALALRRHRAAAALLVVAAGIGAWMAAGAFAPSAPSSAPSPREEWLDRARTAYAEERDADARVALERVLGDDPETAEALDLLAVLDRRKALALGLERARVLAAEVRGAGPERESEIRAALGEVLSERVAPLLPAPCPSELTAEMAAWQRLADGIHSVALSVPGGAEGLRVRAFAVDARDGRVAWDAPRTMSARAGLELEAGRWVVHLRRGDGEVYLPVDVPPGGRAEPVSSPVDPGRVPARWIFVPGGSIRGALGTEIVEPLLWDRHEVTVARYAAFLATLPAEERAQRVPRHAGTLGIPARPLWEAAEGAFGVPSQSGTCPVDAISLHDAQAFARSERARLPTVAEWTRAASGNDGRPTPLGTLEALRASGLVWDDTSESPRPVGSAPQDRSPFGVPDLAGGVAEYTATLATFRGVRGWLVMGGGRAFPALYALCAEPRAVPGWVPCSGVGFRLVRPAAFLVEEPPPGDR